MINQDFIGAVVDFSKAIEFGYNDSECYYLRGDSKFELKDYRGAISDYTTALKTDAFRISNIYNDNCYEARGFAKFLLHDYPGALNDFSKSIENNSSADKSYLYRGKCKIILKQKNNSCLDFSKAGELGNQDAYKLIKKYCN